MAKVDLAAELADVEPEATPAAPRPKPKSAQTKAKATKKSNRRTRSGPSVGPSVGPRAAANGAVYVDQAEVDRLADRAREEAEASAGDVPAVERPPRLTKAQQQQIRRAGRRQVAVELSLDEGRMLDHLAAGYGSQRAAIAAAVRMLYEADEAGG